MGRNQKIKHKFIDGVELKWCGPCKRWLLLDKFPKNISRWDGLRFECRNCSKDYENNKIAKQKKRIRGKKWRLDNPGYSGKHYRANLKKARAYHKQWKINNPEKFKEMARKSDRKRYSTLQGRLACIMRNALNMCLKKGKERKPTFEILGYTAEQLIRRLTKTMPNGYVWDDYMTGKLHLDHIVPISVFNFQKPEDNDFKRCWALKNLQLLPAQENRIKHNKINKHFQPSLIFS